MRGKYRIALFDLDNTLLTGDIGDAVFVQLWNDGHPFPFSWREYKTMCRRDPAFAYREAVRSLEGIPINSVVQATKRILFSGDEFLAYDEDYIPLPKANTIMLRIVQLLQEWNYSIFIISASNDISAKIAGSMLFHIPINNIAGIKSKVRGDILTKDILEPAPIGIGKVIQYRAMSADCIPLVVATDSLLDYPLLQICDPDGTVILVGQNDELYARTRAELFPAIHRIPNTNTLHFQQQRRVV